MASLLKTFLFATAISQCVPTPEVFGDGGNILGKRCETEPSAIKLSGPAGEQMLTGNETSLRRMEVTSYSVTGCWCWQLWSGGQGLGRLHLAGRGGGLGRRGRAWVRSVFRVSCRGDNTIYVDPKETAKPSDELTKGPNENEDVEEERPSLEELIVEETSEDQLVDDDEDIDEARGNQSKSEEEFETTNQKGSDLEGKASDAIEVNMTSTHNSSSSKPAEKKQQGQDNTGIGIGIGTVIVLLALCCYYVLKKKQSNCILL
jgi:hypothetical protein